MKKRDLGKTGIEVSEIAFGSVEIGMPYGIGIENREDMLSEEGAIELLNKALDRGINFFDTARMYGNSEQIIGKAFKNRRNEIVLCTKCRHLKDHNGELPKGAEIDKIIINSFNESLDALKTDFIDVLMLHQVDNEILENREIADTFLKLKREGRIKATGISTYTIEETKKAIDLGIWDVIQLPFNLMDQRQASLFEQARQKGVGIVVRSILLKGLLSDRGKNLHPALKDVEKHIEKFDVFLDRISLSLPELAIKFGLSYPEVSAVLVGLDKMAYLKQTLKAANGIYLNEEELERVIDLSYPDPSFLNLPFWDKMNWLK